MVAVVVKLLRCVRLPVTPWTAAHQAPLSVGFPRQDCSGLPFLHGIFLTQGSNSHLLYWQVDPLLLSHQGNPMCQDINYKIFYISKKSKNILYKL